MGFVWGNIIPGGGGDSIILETIAYLYTSIVYELIGLFVSQTDIHNHGTRLLSFYFRGAGRSSEVERSFMVRWVVGSILHGVDPLSYLSFQPVFHD